LLIGQTITNVHSQDTLKVKGLSHYNDGTTQVFGDNITRYISKNTVADWYFNTTQ